MSSPVQPTTLNETSKQGNASALGARRRWRSVLKRASTLIRPWCVAALPVGVMTAFAVACGSDEDASSCVPNESRACSVGAKLGREVCAPNSTWGACEFEEVERDDVTAVTGAGSGGASSDDSEAAATEQPQVPADIDPPASEDSDEPSASAPDPGPDDELPEPPSEEPSACFEGGDLASIGCGAGSIACCAGSLCIDDAGLTVCAATCSSGADCASGCCVPLSDATASVCAPAETCLPLPPPPPPPPPPPVETVELRGIDRVDSRLYRARISITDIYIETRSCFEFAVRSDGFLVRDSAGATQLLIEGAGTCDVIDIYFSDVPFGTYSLTRVEQVGSNIYRAESGSATLFVDTQLCLALTLLNDGLLIWQGVGSEVFIDNTSGDVCDVVEVYVN